MKTHMPIIQRHQILILSHIRWRILEQKLHIADTMEASRVPF